VQLNPLRDSANLRREVPGVLVVRIDPVRRPPAVHLRAYRPVGSARRPVVRQVRIDRSFPATHNALEVIPRVRVFVHRTELASSKMDHGEVVRAAASPQTDVVVGPLRVHREVRAGCSTARVVRQEVERVPEARTPGRDDDLGGIRSRSADAPVLRGSSTLVKVDSEAVLIGRTRTMGALDPEQGALHTAVQEGGRRIRARELSAPGVRRPGDDLREAFDPRWAAGRHTGRVRRTGRAAPNAKPARHEGGGVSLVMASEV
jgi:hypothetical protein